MPTEPHNQENFGQLLYAIRLSLIRQIERSIANHGYEINFTQLRVLKFLGQNDSMSASELARAVEHDGGALTRVLDRLEEKGYVMRRPNARDRRAIDLSLTKTGRKVWEAINRDMADLNANVLSELSRAEQSQLFSLLHRIRSRVDRLNDNG